MANPSSSDPGAPPATGRRLDDDPFALLGIAPSYDIDPAALERAFFERSKAVHPDRVAAAPAAERVAALSRSRALNDAYQTLKKPVTRAEYLLERAGITIGDNERLDPHLLERVLELREELEEAKAARDRGAIEALCGAMQKRRDQALSELAAYFAANELAEVKRVVMTLRYIDRYLEACNAALDEE